MKTQREKKKTDHKNLVACTLLFSNYHEHFIDINCSYDSKNRSLNTSIQFSDNHEIISTFDTYNDKSLILKKTNNHITRVTQDRSIFSRSSRTDAHSQNSCTNLR